MAQAEHVPDIRIEGPNDYGTAPRILDDATPCINPYFALYEDANVRGLFSSLYPGHVRPVVSMDSVTGLDASSEYEKRLSYQPYIGLYGDASSVSAPNNNFSYPYDFVSYGGPRSPTEAEGSPLTTGSSFDALDGPNSPGVPYGSPFLSSGDPSYAGSSPSLSPITRDLDNFSFEADEAPPEKPSIFRPRSFSATEATVAPSDTWSDPWVRPRSASYSISSSATGVFDDEHLGFTLELDEIDLDDGFPSETGSYFGERGLTSFSNDGFLTSQSASPVPPSVSTTESNSSTLFAPADSLLTATDIMHPKPRHPNPRQPVALALDTDLNTRTKAGGHYRSRSDSSCLSADSPVDRRNNGLIHRSTLSSHESRRHSPYPSPYSSPASASSELSPLYSQEFAALGINDPSSSGSQALHRRSTLSAARSPTLSADSAQLHRFSSDPSSTRYGPQKRRKVKPNSSPGSSTFDISGGSSSTTPDAISRVVSPSESVLSDLPSPDNYKPIVASHRIVQASNSRRTREARFRCEYEGCPSTFTAKHNLRNHMLSHNGLKPYSCSNCGEKFTTQGVRQRHSIKCDPETAKADRRRRKQHLR